MQQQSMRNDYRGPFQFGAFRRAFIHAATILTLLISLAGAPASLLAASNGNDEQGMSAAQRKKAQELLEVASTQLKNHEYESAHQTLDRCRGLNGNLSSSQKKTLENYNDRALAGIQAQKQVDSLIMEGKAHLNADRIIPAEVAFEKALSYKEFLPKTVEKKIEEHLRIVDSRRDQLKKEMVMLFKQSAKQYRNGELDQAKLGFQRIQDSGMELGFFDRGGDLTSTQGYLEKIAAQQGKLAAESTPSQAAVENKPSKVVAETKPSESKLIPESDEVLTTKRTTIPVVEAKPESYRSEPVITDINNNHTPPDTVAPAEPIEDIELTSAAVPASTGSMERQAAAQPSVVAVSQPENPPSEPTATVPAEPKKPLWEKLNPFTPRKPAAKSPETIEKIKTLMAQGDLAMTKGNYAQAKEFFNQVLVIDPELESAQKGLAAAEYNLTAPPRTAQEQEMTLLERVKQQQHMQSRYIETSVLTARANLDQLLEKELFDDARAEVSQVLGNIEGNRQLLGPELYTRLKNQAQAMLQEIDERQAQQEQTALQGQMEQARQREQQRQLKAESARQEKINQLFEQALKFRQAREFGKAVTTLERLLELDEKNKQARDIMEDMKMLQLMEHQLSIARTADREQVNVLDDARAAAIPYSEMVNFPEDWVEKTERRKKIEGVRMYTGSPKKQAVEEKLDNVMVDMDHVEVEFQRVIERLREDSGLNIFPVWNDLELAGIFPEDLLTIQLQQISIRAALERILEFVSGGKFDRLGFIVDDQGVITINTITVLGADYNYYQEVYYVTDLIAEPLEPGEGGTTGGTRGGGTRGGGGGGSREGGSTRSSGGGSSRSSGGGSSRSSGSSRGGGSSRSSGGRTGTTGGGSYMEEDLIWLIQNSIAPYSWDYSSGGGGGGTAGGRGGTSSRRGGASQRGGGYGAAGGVGGTGYAEEGMGTIEIYAGSLVVYNTAEVHRQISDLLKQLRKRYGEQVSIEARFLVINNNFLEDIGLDINFFLNLGNAGFDDTGLVDDNTGRRILQQRANPGPWNRTTPFNVIQNSSQFSVPGQTNVPGTLGGGATPSAFEVSGSFLDNVQVDFLMRATQAHSRSRSLLAPHVTVINGEEASVSFIQTRPYVSGLSAVTANRVGLYEPTTDSADTGIDLYITPTISEDKRYVILNIDLQQNTFLEMLTFTFNEGGTDTEVTTGEGGTLESGNVTTASTGTIQLPIEQENILTTRVKVPDGGTLLLGGQKMVGEVEKEMGVPALSKIPLLKRLFANNSTVKDESVLLILIKPKIILQEEEEDIRFGSLLRQGEE